MNDCIVAWGIMILAFTAILTAGELIHRAINRYKWRKFQKSIYEGCIAEDDESIL